MGASRFGAPHDEIGVISRHMGLTTFIEGGTFEGGTAMKAGDTFDSVVTIEKSDAMHSRAAVKLRNHPRIELLKGDTREHLPALTRRFDRILFWLDAHWSGGLTSGEDDECPLLAELEIIFGSNVSCAILVDDARLFLAPPPKPHKAEHWPSIKCISDCLPAGWDMLVYEDVIYLLPDAAMETFRRHVQMLLSSARNRQHAPPFRQRLKRLLGLG